MTYNNITVAEAVCRYRRRAGAFAPRAALIDMDGTIYNSMPHHTLAWQQMMRDIGVECTRNEFYLYEGMTGAATIRMLLQRAGLPEPSDERVRELYAVKSRYFNEMERVGPVPGVERVLHALRDAGIDRVIVTGSGQASLIDRLEADFHGIFSADRMITSHSVIHGKPHPEPYLRGMEIVGVKPTEAIVLENAPLGIESGHASGAFTIAVTTGPIPPEKLWEAGADVVFPDMNRLADLLPDLLNA
ncbi:MAG: HAD-IA family hydrolase [Muribaculaceae bacterium]|nr:HAD-IA family hydrolase [Muribaculaceae bacterium]